MVVDPVHPVPIVEQRRRASHMVHQESMEPSVQSGEETTIFIVRLDEIGEPCS